MVTKNRFTVKRVINIFLLLLPYLCISQNIDSLEKRITTLKGKEKVIALDDLCYYTSSSDIKKSIIYGNRALSLAKELGDSLLMASCLNDVSLSYFYKGDFDSCIVLAQQAYLIRLRKQKWRDAGASLSKAALGYYEKGNYDLSLEKNLAAIDLFKKENALLDAAKLQSNIGGIYERNNQLDEAKKMYLESAEICLSLKDYQGYVTAQSNFGIILQKQGKINEAISLFNGLIKMSEEYCREETISQLYQVLGVAERKLGHVEKGLSYYLKAKAVYDKIGSLNGMSIINVNIGNCYTDLKKFKEAEEYLQLGLKQAKEIKSLLWQKNAYFGLYDLERLKQNYQLANTYLEKYQLINDSIYNKETQSQLSRLQTQYSLQQKENIILQQKATISENELLLSKRNTFMMFLVSALLVLVLFIIYFFQRNNLKRKQSELDFQRKIQAERSRISKDLHDNMGAELAIINSAIDVKAYAMEKPEDKLEMETISDQVRKASALMRDTIWTVSEEKISVVQFGIKIKEFAERAFSRKNIKVHFKNTSNDFSLRPESTLNLFRIVQEIINNASKHSGAKNFYIENFVDEFVIVLKDDGKGFEPEKTERGYGLNNIANRAKDISANIDFHSVKNEFTKVTITVDKSSGVAK